MEKNLTKTEKWGIVKDSSDSTTPDCTSEKEAQLKELQQKEAQLQLEVYVDEHHKAEFWQVPSGRWATMVKLEDRKYRRKECKTKEGLYKKLFDFYTQQEQTCGISGTSVADIYYMWHNEREKYEEVSLSTLARDDSDWKRFFVKSGWNTKNISTITEPDLEKFIKSTIHSEKLTRKTYGHLRGMIYALWGKAFKLGLTEIKPLLFFDSLDLPKRIFNKVEKNRKDEVFNDEERVIVMNYLRDNPDTLNKVLLLGFRTGLRVGELASLKKSDLEDGCYLHIQRTETGIKDEKGKYHTIVSDRPKTENGNRLVWLDDEALDLVLSQLEKDKGSEWLFIGDLHHKRIVRSSIEHRLTTVCEKCNIKPRSPHKMRKTYASHLIDAGIDDNTITEQIGHKDISTTKSHYYYPHITDNVKIERLKRASSAY